MFNPEDGRALYDDDGTIDKLLREYNAEHGERSLFVDGGRNPMGLGYAERQSTRGLNPGLDRLMADFVEHAVRADDEDERSNDDATALQSFQSAAVSRMQAADGAARLLSTFHKVRDDVLDGRYGQHAEYNLRYYGELTLSEQQVADAIEDSFENE